MVTSRSEWPIPTPVEALPWGSRSMTNTCWPASARQAPRFTAVVLLPTPPFWLAMAMTRAALTAAGDRDVALAGADDVGASEGTLAALVGFPRPCGGPSAVADPAAEADRAALSLGARCLRPTSPEA